MRGRRGAFDDALSGGTQYATAEMDRSIRLRVEDVEGFEWVNERHTDGSNAAVNLRYSRETRLPRQLTKPAHTHAQAACNDDASC